MLKTVLYPQLEERQTTWVPIVADSSTISVDMSRERSVGWVALPLVTATVSAFTTIAALGRAVHQKRVRGTASKTSSASVELGLVYPLVWVMCLASRADCSGSGVLELWLPGEDSPGSRLQSFLLPSLSTTLRVYLRSISWLWDGSVRFSSLGRLRE
jgi:hypothetical protein